MLLTDLWTRTRKPFDAFFCCINGPFTLTDTKETAPDRPAGVAYSFLIRGAWIAQWLERQTRDWKVADSNHCRIGGRILFSRVKILCWFLFRYLFHRRVTALARKTSRSFYQKRRWQVTARHACTLRVWLCMKWHGAWFCGVHRTCAETAALSCGTSHASAVSTPLRWIFKNVL